MEFSAGKEENVNGEPLLKEKNNQNPQTYIHTKPQSQSK